MFYTLSSRLLVASATQYSLLDRPHNRLLCQRASRLTDCNFIIRMLHSDMYWLTLRTFYCSVFVSHVEVRFDISLIKELIDWLTDWLTVVEIPRIGHCGFHSMRRLWVGLLLSITTQPSHGTIVGFKFPLWYLSLLTHNTSYSVSTVCEDRGVSFTFFPRDSRSSFLRILAKK